MLTILGKTYRLCDGIPRRTFLRVGAALAGGGMRLGQVIGETTRLGEAVKTRPVHFREVLATLYHNAGLDARGLILPDLSGRPQHIVGDHRPIPELL